jgi:hypothetical protein
MPGRGHHRAQDRLEEKAMRNYGKDRDAISKLSRAISFARSGSCRFESKARPEV